MEASARTKEGPRWVFLRPFDVSTPGRARRSSQSVITLRPYHTLFTQASFISLQRRLPTMNSRGARRRVYSTARERPHEGGGTPAAGRGLGRPLQPAKAANEKGRAAPAACTRRRGDQTPRAVRCGVSRCRRRGQTFSRTSRRRRTAPRADTGGTCCRRDRCGAPA